MKLKNVTNVDKFFDAVRMCEGYVELVTQNGDRLNLIAAVTKNFADDEPIMQNRFISAFVEKNDLQDRLLD